MNIKIVLNSVFIFCLLLKAYTTVNYPSLNTDNFAQVNVTKNYISGEGFTNTSVNYEDLSSPNYKQSMLWPAGYNLLAAPFVNLTDNYIFIQIFLDTVGIIFLLFSIKYLISFFDFSNLTKIIFWLFLAIAYLPYENVYATDSIAAGFILFGLGYFYKYFLNINITDKNKKIIFHTIISASLFSLASLFRYQFYPVSLGLIIIFMYLLIVRGKKYLKPLILSTVIIILCLFLIESQSTYFETTRLSEGSDINSFISNFDIKGITKIDPFILSIIFPETLNNHIFDFLYSKNFIKNNELKYYFFFTLNYLLIILLAFLTIKMFIKHKLQNINKLNLFLIIMMLLSIAPIAYFRLKGGEINFEYKRIYRYYTLTMVGCTTLLFFIVDKINNLNVKRIILIIILIPNTLFLFFNINRFEPLNPIANLEKHYWNTISIKEYQLMKNLIKNNDNQSLAVIEQSFSSSLSIGCSDKYLTYFAILGGAKGIMFYDDFLNQQAFTSSQDVDIFIAKPQNCDELDVLKLKLENMNATKVLELNTLGFDIYKSKILKNFPNAPK